MKVAHRIAELISRPHPQHVNEAVILAALRAHRPGDVLDIGPGGPCRCSCGGWAGFGHDGHRAKMIAQQLNQAAE